MKPTTGALLRLLGYLIEIACLSLWMKIGAQDRMFAGLSVRNLLLIGVFSGMAMIFTSHFVKKTQRVQKPPRDFLR